MKNTVMCPKGAGVILLATMALLAWGCLAESGFHEIADGHRPALHAVHAEKLAARMAKIDKEYRSVHRLPIRVIRQREFRSLEHCAGLIAEYAAELPQLVEMSELSAEDAAVFQGLAGQLGVHAQALKSAATRQNRPAAREALSKLTSTCNACHASFRHAIGGSSQGGS